MSEGLLAARMPVTQADVQGDSLSMFAKLLDLGTILGIKTMKVSESSVDGWSLHSSGKREWNSHGQDNTHHEDTR